MRKVCLVGAITLNDLMLEADAVLSSLIFFTTEIVYTHVIESRTHFIHRHHHVKLE